MVEKLHRRPLLFRRFIGRNVELLKGYDAVISHAFAGGLFAYEAFMRFGIPYYASWHGSDVHTHPYRVPVIFEDTVRIMESAVCNFFVSKALMQQASAITMNARKRVLYNGVSEDFVKFSPEERAAVRKRYGLSEGEKVVAYAGTLSRVKNVLVLPEIFREVARLYDGSVKFWIAGDGKLRSVLESSVHAVCSDHSFPSASLCHCEGGQHPGVAISFLGDVRSEDMPAVMNCVDVLVLPSLNEGLGMVCAEALRCGANAVGSAVGGIAEVVGKENVVPLGEGFAKTMAERIVTMLTSEVSQELPSAIDWGRTASMELSELLGK